MAKKEEDGKKIREGRGKRRRTRQRKRERKQQPPPQKTLNKDKNLENFILQNETIFLTKRFL
jgi:hypothetical protein